MTLSAEAAALHAVLEDDEGEARRILEGFTPTELSDLAADASHLVTLTSEIRLSRCGAIGPDIPGMGSPECVEPWGHGHGIQHRAHETWGDVQW